jgi:hypothetical protein
MKQIKAHEIALYGKYKYMWCVQKEKENEHWKTKILKLLQVNQN